MIRRLLVPVVLGVTTLAGCGRAAAPTAPAAAGPTALAATPAAIELNVLGAASLQGVLDDTKAAYQAANPGVTLTISTDSSSALETKIEQGEPADVFLSADTKNPQKLIAGGFAGGTLTVFAGNELTIIVPSDNPAKISSPADLAKAGVKVIAAGDEVPITKYASLLVANLAKEPGYPTDFEAAYAANVVSREDNVQAVVSKIELGEGDAAIVYVTDAKASQKVATVDVPSTSQVSVTYSGIVVKASAKAESAQAFLGWFAGPDGQAILARYGFLPPPS
jgi:molybdate transport system substrate-binding protein